MHPTSQLRMSIPPGHWMQEMGGELRPAVHVYLTNPSALTLRQIAVLRAYLFQWIAAGVWDENPAATAESRARLRDLRESAGRVVTVADIDRWLMRAGDEGLDPL